MSRMLKAIRKAKFEGALPEAATPSVMSEKDTTTGLLDATTPRTPNTPGPMSGLGGGGSYFGSEDGAQSPVSSLPSAASHASFLNQREAHDIMASYLYRISRAKVSDRRRERERETHREEELQR